MSAEDLEKAKAFFSMESIDLSNAKIRAQGRKLATKVLVALDEGKIRVAEKSDDKQWITNAWVKRAILAYFSTQNSFAQKAGTFEYFDKLAPKRRTSLKGVRVLPGAVARFGSFVSPGAILMPSFVNVGAFVGAGTMVDTWATVGSCAQIGENVHLAGGVGIGGVLEPAQASPVIIEDHVFVGSRAIVVEGVRVCTQAVIGAGVVLTATTKIIDVRGPKPITTVGLIPERAVVIPGSVAKEFSGGTFGVPCALIIGERKASTDKKTSLNQALRDFGVSV